MTDAVNNQSDPTPTQRSAMRNAIAGQAFGTITETGLMSGTVFLLYLRAQRIPDARLFLYLGLPWVVDALCRLVLAHVADRRGKRMVGMAGACIEVVAGAMLALAPSLPGVFDESVVVAALALYGLGMSMFASSWFALLSPVVPPPLRGRFFGRLRLTWQMSGIAFFSLCAVVLEPDAPAWMYQIVMALLTVTLALRIVFYRRIPEVEEPHGQRVGFFAALGAIVQSNRFVSFVMYVFLLSLFTAGCPALFAQVEKSALGYGDGGVVWFGNLLMAGAVVGFAIAGRWIDRYTAKAVFLSCHFGFGATVLLFLARAIVPGAESYVVAAANFLFGVCVGLSSIAISTEMLALMPDEHKSLSSSLCMTMKMLGASLSVWLTSWFLYLDVLRDQWVLLGQAMSSADAILLAYGMMVILLVVTLGLVPSVVRKAEWTPR